jgi:hypothetical protein
MTLPDRPVPDTAKVTLEVTDPDGEQVRIRPHPRDERGSIAAVEYRHEHYQEWVHVVALDPDDLARLADFARVLVWSSQGGEAGAELREALLGPPPIGKVTPGPSVGIFQVLAPTWERWRENLAPPEGRSTLGQALRYMLRYGRPADDVVFGPRDRFPGQLEEVTDRPVNVDSLNDTARVALMRVLAQSGTAVHYAIGRLTACGEELAGKVITRTGIRERVTCAACGELAEFGGNPPPAAGVVHAIGVDGALRGGCTLQVGDEAATTWSSGGRRVTCPACRAALDDAQPQDVHLRSVTPITPIPTPPAGVAVEGEHGYRGSFHAVGCQALHDPNASPCPPRGGEDVPARPTPWQTHSGDDDFPPHVHEASRALDLLAGQASQLLVPQPHDLPDYPASAYPLALRAELPAFGQQLYPMTAHLRALADRHRLTRWACLGCGNGRVLPPHVGVPQEAAEARAHQGRCPEYAASRVGDATHDAPAALEELVHAAGDRDSETLCGAAITDGLLVAIQDWRGHVTCRACREAAEL